MSALQAARALGPQVGGRQGRLRGFLAARLDPLQQPGQSLLNTQFAG